MSTGKQRRSQAPTQRVNSLSFGGWGNYRDWADHGFLPNPGVDGDPVIDDPSAHVKPRDTARPALPGPDRRPAVDDQRIADPALAHVAALEASIAFEPTVQLEQTIAVMPRPEDRWWFEQPADAASDAGSSADADQLTLLGPRPYVRTGGRTYADYQLRMETMISVTDLGLMNSRSPKLSPDHRSICTMCKSPKSVAEIAAGIQAELGLARILITDAIRLKLVTVPQHEMAPDDEPSIDLLARVYEGLCRLP
jgi:hypothetical protein